MRRVGQTRKRDGNEQAIVKALRKAGAKVIRISEKGAPDLLVSYRDRVFLLEVKQAAGKLTTAQALNAAMGWPVTITRSEIEALRAIGAIR